MQTGSNQNVLRSAKSVAVVTALILLLPLVAMQFTDEVVWDLADFLVAGFLLFGAGLTYKLLANKMSNITYRIAIGVALVAAFVLVWMNLAVGIIGNEGDPANLMYVGVLIVGIIGAIMARFQPRGMARALLMTAIAQAVVAAIAIFAELGTPLNGPQEILMINGFFVALFVISALLFRHAAHVAA
ncbi:MAG: hypothetical protein ACI9HY_001006 [Planctomycetaceae bacterium]|jgi:hypothetical protein